MVMGESPLFDQLVTRVLYAMPTRHIITIIIIDIVALLCCRLYIKECGNVCGVPALTMTVFK